MEFIYTIRNQEVCVDQVKDPEQIVAVPEELERLPVTELGAYALSGSDVEAVYLPLGLRKIGAYAFYNCEKLRRISCGSRVNDLGTGVFAGAHDVEVLDFTLFEGEKSCLKDLLSELRQTLRVRIVERKAECREARLIFPEYFEESVENTPARILFIETHGCGHRYRYCFVNRQFQYKDYDALFSHVKVQEPEALVTELALGRLMYPCGLTERHRAMYLEYAVEHWLEAGKLLIGADSLTRQQVTNLDAGRLPWFMEEVLEKETGTEKLTEKTEKYIELAQQAGDTEMVSWLMDYRHRKRLHEKRLHENRLHENGPHENGPQGNGLPWSGLHENGLQGSGLCGNELHEDGLYGSGLCGNGTHTEEAVPGKKKRRFEL